MNKRTPLLECMIAFLPVLIAAVKDFAQSVNIRFANPELRYFRNEFIYKSYMETRVYEKLL